MGSSQGRAKGQWDEGLERTSYVLVFLHSLKLLLGLIVYLHLERPLRMARGGPSDLKPASSISRGLPGEAWTYRAFSKPPPLQPEPP